MAEFLVWPALIAYGEAAVAYAGSLRNPGAASRLGIWGVRIAQSRVGGKAGRHAAIDGL